MYIECHVPPAVQIAGNQARPCSATNEELKIPCSPLCAAFIQLHEPRGDCPLVVAGLNCPPAAQCGARGDLYRYWASSSVQTASHLIIEEVF
jgi:hypothetical protein